MPFETTYRKTVLHFCSDELQQKRNPVHKNNFLWLLVRTLYLHTIYGYSSLKPRNTSSHLCVSLSIYAMCAKSRSIAKAVNYAVRSLGISRNCFCLLSNTAKYLVAADAILKSLYFGFHVICVAHLLLNCAMKVKSRFEDVDS